MTLRFHTHLRPLLPALVPLLLVQCRSTAPLTDAGPPPVGAIAGATAPGKPADPAPAKPTLPKKSGNAETADDLDEYAVVEVDDPYENLNRSVFRFNERIYKVLRPVARGYEKVLPRRVRRCIDNAFHNAKYPVRLVNSALQGNVRHAALHSEKFLINTTVGLGGLFRPSDRISALAGLPEDDTGKTLAKWGMKQGAYLVIPMRGPICVRDGLGMLGDYALNPINWGIYWSGSHDWTDIPPAADRLRSLPTNLNIYDEATRDSIDPYLAARSAYIQYRAEVVKK